MAQASRNEIALLPKQRLLITESAEEFAALHEAFEQEIRPRGIIEHMYVDDISSIVWEILRLRRCKVVIINTGFRAALENLVIKLLKKPNEFDSAVRDEAEILALGWFTDPEVRKRVALLLSQFRLEEFDVEAEAIRRSLPDLELLNRMLSSLESRRNKALRSIGEYRDKLARHLRETSDRMIEGDGVLRVEHGSGKKPAAA